MGPLGSVTVFVTNRDRCGFQRLLCLLESLHRVHNVCAADDGVALKHRAGFPSTDLHDYAFGDSGPAEVPRGGPAKVMEDQPGIARPLGLALGTAFAGVWQSCT